MAQELPLADIQRIDDLQFEHAVLFDQVPDWAGLQRPKHHALVHIAEDTWNFGPLRGLWCFAFEAVNAIIKLGAHASNFRNEAETVLAYWGMRWTRALVTGQEHCRAPCIFYCIHTVIHLLISTCYTPASSASLSNT